MRADLPYKKTACLLALGLCVAPVIAQEVGSSDEPSAVEVFNKINDIKVLTLINAFNVGLPLPWIWGGAPGS